MVISLKKQPRRILPERVKGEVVFDCCKSLPENHFCEPIASVSHESSQPTSQTRFV